MFQENWGWKVKKIYSRMDSDYNQEGQYSDYDETGPFTDDYDDEVFATLNS